MQYIDQMGRAIWIEKIPERIVSLVPSQTEYLVDLGLHEQIVGVTKFCVHPKGLKLDKAIIGGTKKFNFNRIKALKPDLIIGNKEENYEDGILRLARDYPVWMSAIFDLEDAVQMMQSLGEITGSREKSKKIIEGISAGFLDEIPRKGTAIYLIWQNPMITVGTDTFINEMLQKAGFENLIKSRRYPEISLEQIQDLNPDYLLLSSEPYPFRKEHVDHFQSLFSEAKVREVDGEIFSWYGSRLLKAPTYLKAL